MATNFALASAGATASNSSSSGAGFPASAVINGLRHTNNAFGSGGAWATGSAQPQWVRIQFGQSRTINQIDVFTLADAVNYNTNPGSGDTFTSYGVSAATLKYWDGAAWQTITSYSSNNKVWKTLTFSDIATTEIEVYVTASPDGVSRLVEIEAWGPDVVDTTPDITTTTLPATTVGASYSQTIARTGGESPFVWDVTVGSLPPGLSLNTSTGAITGTPTTAGTYNFTVRVRDENAAAGCESDTQALSIVVNAAPVITTTSLPDGTVGSAYSQTIAKTGGTGSGTFAVQSGSLPAGLSLNTSTGAITGTPTTPGTSSFTIRYTDTVSVYDDQALTIFIDGQPTITTGALLETEVGADYSQVLSVSGGNGSITWSHQSGSLPPGITFNAGAHKFEGIPTTPGSYSGIAIRATDADGDYDQLSFTIIVAAVIYRKGYEILQSCGDFGSTEAIRRAKFRADYGEGYNQSALFGAKTGLKSWRLTWKTLLQNLGAVNPWYDNEAVNRADYLWDFWNRYDASGLPFVIQSKRNGQYYLAEFADEELTYELVWTKLFSTGLLLRQRRVADVSVYDPTLTPRASRFYNAAELDYANDSSVTTFPDDVGSADATAAATKPVYKTNQQNGNGIIRFNGTSKPLINTDPLTIRHLFIVAKHSDAEYVANSALVAEPGHDILTTLGTDDFYPLDLQFDQSVTPLEVYVNGVNTDLGEVPMPYATWKLYEIRFLEPYAATGLIIGADHNGNSGVKWKGDIGDVFVSEEKMFESDVWEFTEETMRKWGIH